MAVCPPHCLQSSALSRQGAVGPTSSPLRQRLHVLSVERYGSVSAVSATGRVSAVVFIPSFLLDLTGLLQNN